jgi:hypothetical protein
LTGDEFGCDVAGGAWLGLDDELLAEVLGKLLCKQPRNDVGGAARGLADDEAPCVRATCGAAMSETLAPVNRRKRRRDNVIVSSPFGLLLAIVPNLMAGYSAATATLSRRPGMT